VLLFLDDYDGALPLMEKDDKHILLDGLFLVLQVGGHFCMLYSPISIIACGKLLMEIQWQSTFSPYAQ
jgi:hypothetical protein